MIPVIINLQDGLYKTFTTKIKVMWSASVNIEAVIITHQNDKPMLSHLLTYWHDTNPFFESGYKSFRNKP